MKPTRDTFTVQRGPRDNPLVKRKFVAADGRTMSEVVCFADAKWADRIAEALTATAEHGADLMKWKRSLEREMALHEILTEVFGELLDKDAAASVPVSNVPDSTKLDIRTTVGVLRKLRRMRGGGE